MEINIEEIFRETILISLVKRKLNNGEELTEEEKDQLLQQIYASSKKELRKGQELRSTKSKIAFRTLSIVTKMLGEKGKGYHDATKTVLSSTRNNVDNYRKILKGVDITAKNQIVENFTTLLAQYEAADNYGELMSEFMLTFIEANDSYKKNYEQPIGVELAEQMSSKRTEILELEKRYIKK